MIDKDGNKIIQIPEKQFESILTKSEISKQESPPPSVVTGRSKKTGSLPIILRKVINNLEILLCVI